MARAPKPAAAPAMRSCQCGYVCVVDCGAFDVDVEPEGEGLCVGDFE